MTKDRKRFTSRDGIRGSQGDSFDIAHRLHCYWGGGKDIGWEEKRREVKESMGQCLHSSTLAMLLGRV